MLSVFPNLLNWWMIAPVILRAALGLALIHEGYGLRHKERTVAILKLLTGILLLIAYLTQVAALFALLFTLYELWQHKQPTTNDNLLFKLAIAAALLFLGPGAFSLDLPL